jgi:TrpR-related protein YerC/YecD
MSDQALVPTPSRDVAELVEELCAALLTPADPGQMRLLLADLCTPAEIRTIAERWHVARLLDHGALSYREIQEATGVSTTTVVRVARFLRLETNGGYRRALDAGKGRDAR